MNLSEKVVLVTGGAVRLGRAICLELAEAGAKIFCHYHSSGNAALSLKQKISANGGSIHIFKCDLSEAKAPQNIINEVIRVFGRIDVLINNAAVFYKTPLGSVTEKDWDAFTNLNLKSAFFIAQESGRHMLKQKTGKIINISDAAAVSPFPAFIPYSISKAGIIAMTIGLAKALAPHIQVNCINPGTVMLPENMSEEDKSYALDQTLLKREGCAEDVAKSVRFLLEGSDYITGAILPVDGGRQIR